MQSGVRWQLMYGTLKYLWPDDLGLKTRLVACFVFLVIGRAVNLAVSVSLIAC